MIDAVAAQSREKVRDCLLVGHIDAGVARFTAERSIEIERLMRADIQTTLRRNLGNLNDPKGLADVVRFYRDLELNREADAWQAIIDSLESVEKGGA